MGKAFHSPVPLTLLIVMCRNLFQLLFGQSILLEPFSMLDTTNYLGKAEWTDQTGNKTGPSSTNHPPPLHPRSSLALKASALPNMFSELLTITAPMAKTSSPTIPVKGMR